MANEKKYRRRKYGRNVVIYTVKGGTFLIIHSYQADPGDTAWNKAGRIIDALNKTEQ